MDEPHTDSVTVAVTTFRRPGQLATGLPRILAQVEASPHAVSLMVVDNDHEPSAEDFVRSLSPAIHYVHEPRPGVSAARNAALQVAPSSGALIFVDDDTSPVDGWLDAMIELWHRHTPAAVSGSVSFVFESTTDEDTAHEWGEFEDTRRPTGSRCASAASRNLLLDRRFLDAHGLRFDESLGLIGGEDTLLTRQLASAGGEILWCDEARVLEQVPGDRVARRWMLRRAYRSGGSWAYAVIRTSPARPLRTRLRLAGRATAIIGVRAVSAGLQLLLRRARGARRAWRDVYSQAGVVMISLGARGLREYGRR